MKIRLDLIKTYFISPCEGKYLERCERTRELGVEMKNVFLHEKSGKVYPDSLNDAHVRILRKNNDNAPVLILEDDVKWDGTLILDVPSDADAVYLGNSNAGNTLLKWAHLKKFNSDYYRVLSMRATHAIVYISSRYKKAAADAIENGGVVLDASLASMQKGYTVYTKDIPVFYQADTPNEAATQKTASKIVKSSILHYSLISLCISFCLLVALVVVSRRRSAHAFA